jgi:hypothetical protein
MHCNSTADASNGFAFAAIYAGSTLDVNLNPGTDISCKWVDPGPHGAWTASAHVPLAHPDCSSVSIRRSWKMTAGL